MPRYSYTAYDRKGTRTGGEVVATSRDSALDALARRGEFPVDIRESLPSAPVKWWQREVFAPGALRLPVLAMFTRELVSLIKADLPVDECLRLVALQPMIPSRMRRAAETALARVVEGEALSDALAGQGKTFPEYYWRLVRAGEASGSLGDCLEDLARFLETSAETRSRVLSALLYPAVLVAAAIAALAVIVAVLLPALAPIFEEAGAEPPFLISALGGVSRLLADHWMLILPAITATLIGLFALFRRTTLRTASDRFLLRLPVSGRVIERRETGRLARTLATLIKNGVPIVDAVRIGASVLSNKAMAEAVRRAGEGIKEGGLLSAPLASSGLFSDLFIRLTVIGERTGQLDSMLQRAADIYESALQRQMQRLTSLVTPVVTLLIGAFVGGLILSVMSALISINDLALK